MSGSSNNDPVFFNMRIDYYPDRKNKENPPLSAEGPFFVYFKPAKFPNTGQELGAAHMQVVNSWFNPTFKQQEEKAGGLLRITRAQIGSTTGSGKNVLYIEIELSIKGVGKKDAKFKFELDLKAAHVQERKVGKGSICVTLALIENPTKEVVVKARKMHPDLEFEMSPE